MKNFEKKTDGGVLFVLKLGGFSLAFILKQDDAATDVFIEISNIFPES